jgi:CheY-like chemotaxis protein
VIDDDLHDGHAPGAPVSCAAAERAVDSLCGSNALTNPPALCFGEGWRPGWPQGSGKRNEDQYKRHPPAAQFCTDAHAHDSPCGLLLVGACCPPHAFLSTGPRPVPPTALIKARSQPGDLLTQSSPVGQPSAPLHAVARVVTGPFVMDAFINPSATVGEVVLLAIEDEDLLAMMALALEMSGCRVVAVDVLRHTSARAQEVHPHAIVADLRDGDARGWHEMHRLQHETSTATARLVVLTERPDAVPAEILRDGAAVVTWPFAVGELLQALTAP